MILRYLSIAFAAVAVLWPSIVLLRLNDYIDGQRARGLAVEGKEVANVFMTAIPSGCLLAFIACTLAWVAYFRLPRPRPRNRRHEAWFMTSIAPVWIALSLPLFAWISA